MRVQLLITHNEDSTLEAVDCELDSRLVLGRDFASPARLDGVGVSREHFALVSKTGDLLVEDLSSNGTSVNGSPMRKGEPVRLTNGDLIEVPGYKIEISWPSGQLETTAFPSRSSIIEKLPVPRAVWEYLTSFTTWEWFLIASALCTFVLILFYLNW